MAEHRHSNNSLFFQKLLSGSVVQVGKRLLPRIHLKVQTAIARNYSRFAIPYCASDYLRNQPFARQ